MFHACINQYFLGRFYYYLELQIYTIQQFKTNILKTFSSQMVPRTAWKLDGLFSYSVF